MPYQNTNNPNSSAGVSQQTNKGYINNLPTSKIVTPNLVNPGITEIKKNFPEKQVVTPSNLPQKTLANNTLKQKIANKMTKKLS